MRWWNNENLLNELLNVPLSGTTGGGMTGVEPARKRKQKSWRVKELWDGGTI